MADPTPEEIRFQEEIKLLVTVQLQDMDPNIQQLVMGEMQRISEEYREAREKAEQKDLDDKQKKYYGDLAQSIGKSLPDISKGAFAAAAAFKKGDNIGGAAAVMDICAAVVPVFTALLAAGGPPGMIIGALFSVVGQILAFFAPKAPSLKDEIEKLLQSMVAKEQMTKMVAVDTAIHRYATSLRNVGTSIPKVLAMPLVTEANADDFREKLKALEIGLVRGQQKLDVPEFAGWEVAAWLKDKDNYENEKWPEVLGHWCRAYANLVTANVMLKCLVNPKRIKELLAATAERGPSTLPPKARDHVHTLLISLEALADAARTDWQIWSKVALQVQQALESVARDRGLTVHRGRDGDDYYYLYASTGAKGFQSGGTFERAGRDYLGNGYVDTFAIANSAAYAGSLTPRYNIFLWRSHNAYIFQAMIDSTSLGTYYDERPAIEGSFTDVWALPIPKEQGKPDASYVFASSDKDGKGALITFRLETGGSPTTLKTVPVTSGVVAVRAVMHPRETLPNDPDADGLPPALLGGVDHTQAIQYGALKSSPNIFVVADNHQGYVPTPWPYTGIAVDDYCLWVFQPQGIACLTHAAVMKGFTKPGTLPRWMAYYVTSMIGDNEPTTHEGPVKGVISLSPCKDGTLSICVWRRNLTAEGNWRDALWAYTTTYDLDLKAGTLKVAEPWVKSASGGWFQTQKMPIPCWDLFKKLETDLLAASTSA